MAGLHRSLSPIRYVARHFLHVFTYIPLTCVQLFIDKHRPFAQIEIDVSAHAQIFTAEGIPSGTEALTHLVTAKQKSRGEDPKITAISNEFPKPWTIQPMDFIETLSVITFS